MKTSVKVALLNYLDGTVWEIGNTSPDLRVLYSLKFNNNGTFKLDDETAGALKFTGANTFMMSTYDPETLSDDFDQFRAKGAQAI